MVLYLPNVLAFLTLAMVAAHAALSPELYWNSVLPNTPMPKAITDLLHPELEDEKSTSVIVGKGINVDAGRGKPGSTSVNVGKGGVTVNTGNGKPNSGTHVSVGGKGGVGVNTGKPGQRTKVGVGKKGVSVGVQPGRKGKPVYVGVNPGVSPFIYNYAATENQLRDDPNVAYFFLEKDLHPGKTMTVKFTESSVPSTFLPRQVADSIPFSSKKLPEIFDHFSVKSGSLEAKIMTNAIKECEESGIKGEEKFCPTSLESMIDFTTSKLGKNVQAISTEAEKQTELQKYTITYGVKKLASDKSVVCHKQNYAYAVFYCHSTQRTRAYQVPLAGADGTTVKAVAVCHTDTSTWNPKHLAFQVLKITPGTVPVCHFLPQDHIVWVQN